MPFIKIIGLNVGLLPSLDKCMIASFRDTVVQGLSLDFKSDKNGNSKR